MLVRLEFDENFNGIIVRQLLRKYPNLDLMRVQDSNVYGLADDIVLEWAAAEGRILLTHDLSTMPYYAYLRINSGISMPGLFAISETAPFNQVVDDLILIIEGSEPDEWKDLVEYLPL